MNPETLKLQLSYCQWVIQKNTEDITHEESLRRPTTGGNCLNWLLGHLTASRQQMLITLEQEPLWRPEAMARFNRNSPPVTGESDSLPLAEMVEIHQASLDRINKGLEEITVERLAGKASFSPTNNENETIGSLLASLVFHEAYHTGQTSYWRRALGKDPSFK